MRVGRREALYPHRLHKQNTTEKRNKMSTDTGRLTAVTVTSRFKTNVLTSSTIRYELMLNSTNTYAQERSQILAVLEGVMNADHVIVSYQLERESV